MQIFWKTRDRNLFRNSVEKKKSTYKLDCNLKQISFWVLTVGLFFLPLTFLSKKPYELASSNLLAKCKQEISKGIKEKETPSKFKMLASF
jgi:hypothetical protein